MPDCHDDLGVWLRHREHLLDGSGMPEYNVVIGDNDVSVPKYADHNHD